jgi:hypothetical protein
MVLAGETFFVAGPADVLNEDDAFNRPNDPKVKAEILAQQAAYEGKTPAVLMAVSATKGEKLFRLDLSAPPVWDGMAAADGKLYMAMSNGTLVCMEPDK